MLHSDGAITMPYPVGPFRKMPLGGGAKFPSRFPLSLPHLEEYYDSRTPTGAHGSAVAPWSDLSGNGRNMGVSVPFTSPTLNKTSGLSPKGTQLVHWDGVGGATGMLLNSGTINPFPPSIRGHSFYCYGTFRQTVAPPAPFGGSQIWLTSLFNSCPRELINQTNATLKLAWRDNGGFHGTHAFATGVHQFAWTFDTLGNGNIYIDGVLIETIGYTFAGNAADDTIMGGSANVPLNADMGHFVWYSDYHTQSIVTQHKQWASIFWGF
jgi:hypothetical protein